MATSTSSEIPYNSQNRAGPTLIRDVNVRCPCCGATVAKLPAPWKIEPCCLCKRPLILVRVLTRETLYRLRNVIDLAGSIYGVVTMMLVLSFMSFEMAPLSFAKAVTVLLFLIGSILTVDGVLGLQTSIDRSWKVTRRGSLARALGMGKVAAGLSAMGLVVLGLSL